MNEQTRYRYEKRIKELEQQTVKLCNERDRYRLICFRVFDWLAPFAGDKEKKDLCPNAAYGVKLFRDLLWL